MERLENIVVERSDIKRVAEILKEFFDKKEVLFNKTDDEINVEKAEAEEFRRKQYASNDFSNEKFQYRSHTNKRGRSDLTFDVTDKDVLIIEDILDSGITLTALRAFVAKHKPASLKVCTLLDKPERRQLPITADYTGFECPNEFVVGYGLDYGERYRNLPFVASLKPEVYS